MAVETPVGALEISDEQAAVVRLVNVSKRFGEGRRTTMALVNFSLAVAHREFVCVLGASGCGKSTLLKLIAGLQPVSAGTIERSPIVARQGGIGMVFQTPVLLPWRSVLRNVLAPAEVLDLLNGTEATARALIERVGLKGFEKAFPHQLSGGMQQRVSIARALLSDPPLLLMDEPFGALDALTREQMNLDLQRVWMESAKTVILVTHSIEEAAFLGDRIVVMAPRPGRIAEVVDNPLPRPRDLRVMGTPEFAALEDYLRRRVREVSSILEESAYVA
jgi:NitT/TauT family transport system ATP-binding protein